MGDESTVDGLIERVQEDLVATRRAPLDIDEAEAAARLQAELFGEAAEEQPLQIGRYAVEGRLGRGGMGVVFAAVDTQLDRKVALKVLRKKGIVEPRRLRREARSLAQLSHPNIVEVYDVGLDDSVRRLRRARVRRGARARPLDPGGATGLGADPRRVDRGGPGAHPPRTRQG